MELREIEGFPDYKVSDDGRIWSNNGRCGRCGWLKGSPDKDGYLIVSLYVGGKHCTKKIHRLVAETFLPNPNNLPQINHKDEDKTNNCVSNLEWCDHYYNNNYGTRVIRANAPEHNVKRKATQQQRRGKSVVQLTLDGQEIARYCCANEAARQTGFSQGGISMVCRGEGNTFKGFRWQYLPKEEEDGEHEDE